jgi:undecaprenyl-diphosphatase
MADLTYVQSAVIGALQGVTELFPISSLGHSVLVPALIGGSWKHLVTENATTNSEGSPYLAFIVALHVATAFALLLFYWRDWLKIIGAFFHTLRTRKAETSTERLAWLIVIATIPVGVLGLALEHTFRTLFAKPVAASAFLFVNGLILLGGEVLRRRVERRDAEQVVAVGASGAPVAHGTSGSRALEKGRSLETFSYREALFVGVFQTLALLAGISRSGVTMVAGLLRGLDHEDAAKFAFLLATPVIFAAGVLKLPSLFGPAGNGIHGQVLVGSLVAFVAALVAIKFLTRWFTTQTLTPFAVYCLLMGGFCLFRFA